MTRRALIKEADLRRLVKVVLKEAPGSRMTVDLEQNRLHFILSDKPAEQQTERSKNPLDWLLHDTDSQAGAPQ